MDMTLLKPSLILMYRFNVSRDSNVNLVFHNGKSSKLTNSFILVSCLLDITKHAVPVILIQGD